MDPRLSDAQRAWQRGDKSAALAGLRTLAKAPDASCEIFEVLAQISLDQGLVDDAGAATERALSCEPDRPDLWQQLGSIALQRRDFPAAQQAFGKVFELAGESASARTNLGLAFQQAGSLARAVECHRRALSLDPNNLFAICNLAAALGLMGGYDEALALSRRAVQLRPDFINAYMQAAFLEADREHFDEALAWIAAIPRPLMQNAAALTSHAEILSKASLHQAAIAVADRAIALQPDYMEAHLSRGTALSALGRQQEALLDFNRASTLAPQSATALTGKAATLLELGRSDEAKDHFERARALEPRSPKVLYMRAAAKEFRLDDGEIGELEALLADPQSLSANERVNLHFALAGAYLNSGDNDKVFPHLDSGNRLKRSMVNYDQEGAERFMRAMERAFAPEMIARAKGTASDAPIFVVGVPRSGTTLVEQILASHPQVLGRGELRDFADAVRDRTERYRKPFPEWVTSLSIDDFRDIGADYLQRVGPLPAGKTRFVDKMPGNAVMAGPIHCALPNARIILCRRDPFDTCFSCYSRLFTTRLGFTYNLSDLGHYFRAHDELMAHWRRVLPGDRFIEVNYEDVVANFAEEARKIVAFCGLDWSDECLRFHESKRPVRTASMLQVRKPLYSSSIGRWRPFRTELAPLFEALSLPVPD